MHHARDWATCKRECVGNLLGLQLAVLTCMDSRLPPEEFLGLKIGDAEVIRNGGGRVTADVLRFFSPAAATAVAVQYAQQYHLLRSAVPVAFASGQTR